MPRVSTYQGTPNDVPSTTVVSHAPGKNALFWNRFVGVGSSAPVFARPPCIVVPIIDTSGVCFAAIAADSFWPADSHGTVVTVTFASGFSAVKAFANSASFSPSVPIAHTVMSPLALPSPTALAVSDPPLESRPQPAATLNASAAHAATATNRCLIGEPPGSGFRNWSGRPAR
jgi:hypothetical protein